MSMTTKRSLDEGSLVAARSAPIVEGDTPAMRKWAEPLVERARAEGVELTGDDGLLTAMDRQVLQTGLEVELGDHLGHEPYDPAARGSGNSRHRSSPTTVTTDVGEVELGVRATATARSIRRRSRSINTVSMGSRVVWSPCPRKA